MPMSNCTNSMNPDILKIEASSGLSGDMFLGALAQLTGGYEELKELPKNLGVPNVEVKISELVRNGVDCYQVKIVDHCRTDQHSHHSLKEIYRFIKNGDIPLSAKEIAKEIYRLLGEAEAAVHGTDLTRVVFHEVGAVDSILDIVGCALLLDKLNIRETCSTPVRTGYGFVKTAHGKLPVPAPATECLLQGIPLYPGNAEGELCTPTGAAILKFLNPGFSIPPLIEEKVAFGPGEKDFGLPNLLRISLCRPPLTSSGKRNMAE